MRLSQLEILRYAKEGLLVLIGSHPCPNGYPYEIEEYEAHLKEVDRRIAQRERKERRDEDR